LNKRHFAIHFVLRAFLPTSAAHIASAVQITSKMAAVNEQDNNEALQDVTTTGEASTEAEVADATAVTNDAPGNNKRKFDEEEAGPEGDEDRQFKRAVTEPDSVQAAGSAEVRTCFASALSSVMISNSFISDLKPGLPQDCDANQSSEAATASAVPLNGEEAGDATATEKEGGLDTAAEPANAEILPEGNSGAEAPVDLATLDTAAVPAVAAPVAVDAAAAMAAAAATASALTQNAPAASVGVSAPGGLEHTLQVPGSMVGKLIGKQGETIKALQYSTQTRIQVDVKSSTVPSSNRRNFPTVT
jgi:hypothetical protein